jgi:catechol-2,3-dioxygenase
MIKDGEVFATIAVKDLNKGKQFYGETLGLESAGENPGGISYSSGGGRLFIYESQTAGTNKATCASWKVDDVEASVEDLKGKGISFEHYDMPDATLEGEINVWWPVKAAWFKDHDGNILSVGNA